MSRPSHGARLCVRRRQGRKSWYAIRDGETEISAGILVGEDRARERATEALEAYLARQRKADFGDGDPRRVLISDVLDLYRTKKVPRNRRPDVDESAIAHLAAFLGQDTVSEVTPDRATRYVTWRTAMPQARFKEPGEGEIDERPRVGQATARRELEVLSAAIGFAHREHKLAYTIVIALPEKAQPRHRWLTRDEAALLIRAAYRGGAKHLARFILIALYTGTRHEAVLRLRWIRAIDAGSIDLKAGLIYRRGSREADSDKRRPPIPISRAIAGHLRRWHRSDALQGITHAVTLDGAPLLRLRRSWNTARRAAGLGPDVVPHVLRHTFATWAIQNGHSLAKVAAALGTSERIVEQTYGHHAPDHLRDVVDFRRKKPSQLVTVSRAISGTIGPKGAAICT